MRTGIMAGAGCPPELMKRAAQSDEMNMTGIVIGATARPRSAPGSHHERLDRLRSTCAPRPWAGRRSRT